MVARSLSLHGELQGREGKSGKEEKKTYDINTPRPRVCLEFRRHGVLRSCAPAVARRSRSPGALGTYDTRLAQRHIESSSHPRDDEPGRRAGPRQAVAELPIATYNNAHGGAASSSGLAERRGQVSFMSSFLIHHVAPPRGQGGVFWVPYIPGHCCIKPYVHTWPMSGQCPRGASS